MSRISIIAAAFLACSLNARADICLWSGTPGNVSIVGANVEILAAGTYKFEAVTSCGSSTTLADIGAITINSSVTGTVTVYIESRSDNNTAGAVNVGSINLTNTSGVTGELAELRITGDLGTPSVASEVTAITGVASVGGDLLREFNTNGLTGSFAASAINKTLKITGTHTGAITAATLTQTGNIWLSGAGTHTGSVTVTGGCRGSLLAGTSGTSATVSGDWTVGGDLTGNIRICGTMNGINDILGEVNQASDVPSRPIYITTLNNVLRIRGALKPDPGVPSGSWNLECDSADTSPVRTVIIGTMGSGGAVATDYDGYDSEHNWSSSAIIRKGSTDYTANIASERLYRITCCKGDMNNDGVVNSFDIDPFVMAITDPNDYDDAFPGLDGSRVYHADVDDTDGGGPCDGLVNNFDFDRLTYIITSGGCCVVD
ncbi:MAG: hypothetical protein AB7Q17_06775 [Phycisphaerae bacterium]